MMGFGAPTPPAGGSGGPAVDATARAAAATAQAAAELAFNDLADVDAKADAADGKAVAAQATASAAVSAASVADGKAVTAQSTASGAASAASAAQADAAKALTWRGLVARLTTALTIAANTNTRVPYNSVILDKSSSGLTLGSGADAGKIAVGSGVSYVRVVAQWRWENTSNYRSFWVRQSRGGSTLEDYIGMIEEREPYASQVLASRPIAVQSGDVLELYLHHQTSTVNSNAGFTQYSVTVEIVE